MAQMGTNPGDQAMMISLRRLRARRRRRLLVKNCLDRLSAAIRNTEAAHVAIEQKTRTPAGRK
jgi:hypothetical protein